MISIENLHLALPGFALKDISLAVSKGGLLVLVGPSGSGKTLLLETIAGLRHATCGVVRIAKKDVTYLEPEKRNIGMVYQDCALFPHLTVAENIAFGLKVRQRVASEIGSELDKMARLFNIAHLYDRMPVGLSGGEKQKVALARAMVTDPLILLLDEPLASLDPQTKEGVRREILRVNSEIGLTMVFVTHDFDEALSVGTQVAVMGDGLIRQTGSPSEIFKHPNSEFVARFTMTMNLFSGIAVKSHEGTSFLFPEGLLIKTVSPIFGECFAAIRPENIFISSSPVISEKGTTVRGRVSDILKKSQVVSVLVHVPPSFTCLVTRPMLDQMDIKVGQMVYLHIPGDAVTLFKG